QELMGLRDLRDKLQDCWFGYDQSRIPVASAEQAWQVANADLAREIGHTRSLRAKLDQVLVQLQAALAREGQRNRPRVAFHYWAHEAVDPFLQKLERARRMTYLFLRSAERDLQMSLDLDSTVLTATHPNVLEDAHGTIEDNLALSLDGRVVKRKFQVVRV